MSQPSADTGADVGTGRPALGADLILPLFAVALTVYYLIDTWGLSWEAKATGFIVGLVLLTICAIQIMRVVVAALTGRANLSLGGLIADTQDNRRRLGLILLAALFIGTIQIVGTTLGLFVLLFGGMWIMGVRNSVTLIGVSATTAAVVYLLLILLLGTRLPRGVIENTLAIFGLGA